MIRAICGTRPGFGALICTMRLSGTALLKQVLGAQPRRGHPHVDLQHTLLPFVYWSEHTTLSVDCGRTPKGRGTTPNRRFVIARVLKFSSGFTRNPERWDASGMIFLLPLSCTRLSRPAGNRGVSPGVLRSSYQLISTPVVTPRRNRRTKVLYRARRITMRVDVSPGWSA